MKPSRLPLKSHIGDPSPLINVRFREHRTRNQIVARRMSLIGALITSLALLVSTPGVANADQFRNNQWVFGSIEREFIDFLSGANQYGQGGTSSIGEPTSGELYAGNSNEGRWQEFGFTNRIYWSPNVDPNKGRQIGGLIMNKWLNLPSRQYRTYVNGPYQYEKRSDERGRLGYPVTRESPASGGRYNNFQGGAITYKFGATSAYATWGNIRDQWAAQNYELGPLGFPSSDEYLCQDGTTSNDGYESYGASGQNFQNGQYLTSGRRPPTLGYSSVLFSKLTYQSSSQYTTAISQASTAWNALGSVQVTPYDPVNPTLTNVEISDANRPDVTWAGLYSNTDFGVDTIQMNTAKLGNASNQRNVMTHEMGHALGLAHNCKSQLMDPISNSSVFAPQFMDQAAYRQLWG
ncbi:matrixin family metalloprotease [Rhodococcus sp. 14-2496-1d]|uniref:matrixin family metalloprotease n=1 Tax=Rhodococcus sp. 14-2496-1d TaxID=2023146 RepID=UPI0015C5CCE4|nr:matrixin family metalloprotease [Rhodococcus sp. 14-2496-1d]